jgi:hypothetical protein
MLAITHLVVVLLLIKVMELDRQEATAALLFGVIIDLDHIFGMADYVSKVGWGNAANVNMALTSDVQWKSLMHQPVAAVVVGPIAALFRFSIPLLAWGVHLIMDYVQIEYLGVASAKEMVFLLSLAFLLLFLELSDFRERSAESGWARFLEWEKRRVLSMVQPIIPQRMRVQWA